MIRAGDTIENPVTGERHRLPQDLPRDRRPGRRHRDARAAERLRRSRARPPEPGGALRVIHGRSASRSAARSSSQAPGSGSPFPPDPAPFLERGRRRGALRLRDPPGTAVRAADRDDVLARGRGPHEPHGDAGPVAARRDRERALRHRAVAVPARGPAALRTRARKSGGAGAGVHARSTSRPRPGGPSRRRASPEACGGSCCSPGSSSGVVLVRARCSACLDAARQLRTALTRSIRKETNREHSLRPPIALVTGVARRRRSGSSASSSRQASSSRSLRQGDRRSRCSPGFRTTRTTDHRSAAGSS